MIEYFLEQDFFEVKKQRKRVLIGYIIVAAVYLVFSVGMFLWYRTLPYMSPTITTVKAIQYSVTAIFVIFSFIYMGIYFNRVNKYYNLTYNLMTGIRETSTGSFFEYDESLQDKDGVDFKALIFIEWNKYKNDFFERKVLVFDEKPFPELTENQNVKYVTQGNVLISYEILS
jgi:hypothetical protein